MKKKLLKNNIRNLRFFKSKLISTLFVVLIFLTQNLMAQEANSNENQLVAKCLTFQPLQDVIPAEIKAQMATYQVLNNDASSKIPSTLAVAGKSTSLISEATIGTNKPYYKFHLIKVDGNNAFVRYSFFYNENGVAKKVQVHAEFEKKKSEWIATNNKFISDLIKL